MINKIIRLKNNIVMVLDEHGEQLPEYQGFYYDVHDKILASAPASAVFNHWCGSAPVPVTVPAEEW